jgi:DNA repair exonuclease SbcCD ATPase subunit
MYSSDQRWEKGNMARPLSASDPYRGGFHGGASPRYTLDGPTADEAHADPELEILQSENAQLRQLCAELEQALQEAAGQMPDVSAFEERIREYDLLLEEKTETIRQLHERLEEAETQALGAHSHAAKSGAPAPREDELLALSEELERERRQLQEDEQSLMEQMRQMEMAMARERAEMARQRNDLQRLFGEIRHELERLERTGAIQSKMDELKSKLQDVSTRRGAAPGGGKPAGAQPSEPAAPASGPAKGGFFGRLFGGKEGS